MYYKLTSAYMIQFIISHFIQAHEEKITDLLQSAD